MLHTHTNLVRVKKYIEWIISKKASITLLPFEIISECIIKYLDSYSALNLLYAIRKNYKNDKFFMDNVVYNFTMIRIYTTIREITQEILCLSRPYTMDTYIFPDWSPFSEKIPQPVAKVKILKRSPYFSIEFNHFNISIICDKKIHQKCTETRLVAHANSGIKIKNWYAYRRRKYWNIHPTPLIVQVADASSVKLYYDQKEINLLNFNN